MVECNTATMAKALSVALAATLVGCASAVGCHPNYLTGKTYAIGEVASTSVTTVTLLSSVVCSPPGVDDCPASGFKTEGGYSSTDVYNFQCISGDLCSIDEYAPGSISSESAWTRESMPCSSTSTARVIDRQTISGTTRSIRRKVQGVTPVPTLGPTPSPSTALPTNIPTTAIPTTAIPTTAKPTVSSNPTTNLPTQIPTTAPTPIPTTAPTPIPTSQAATLIPTPRPTPPATGTVPTTSKPTRKPKTPRPTQKKKKCKCPCPSSKASKPLGGKSSKAGKQGKRNLRSPAARRKCKCPCKSKPSNLKPNPKPKPKPKAKKPKNKKPKNKKPKKKKPKNKKPRVAEKNDELKKKLAELFA